MADPSTSGPDSPSTRAPVSAEADSVDNPLPECPDTPNCVRTSRPFEADADSLFQAVQDALTDLGPVRLEVTPETRRVHAVYRVALLFKDDVDVVVTESFPQSDGPTATLHVRSASRVGYSDLGVNARRVDHLYDAVEDHL